MSVIGALASSAQVLGGTVSSLAATATASVWQGEIIPINASKTRRSGNTTTDRRSVEEINAPFKRLFTIFRGTSQDAQAAVQQQDSLQKKQVGAIDTTESKLLKRLLSIENALKGVKVGGGDSGAGLLGGLLDFAKLLWPLLRRLIPLARLAWFADFAQKHNVLKMPDFEHQSLTAALVETLDPGLADRLFGEKGPDGIRHGGLFDADPHPWDSFEKGWDHFSESVRGGVKQKYDDAVEVLKGIAGNFGTWGQNLSDKLTDTFSNAIDNTTDKIHDLWDRIYKRLSEIDLSSYFNSIKELLAGLWEKITGKLGKAWEAVSGFAKSAVEKAGAAANNLQEKVLGPPDIQAARKNTFTDPMSGGVYPIDKTLPYVGADGRILNPDGTPVPPIAGGANISTGAPLSSPGTITPESLYPGVGSNYPASEALRPPSSRLNIPGRSGTPAAPIDTSPGLTLPSPALPAPTDAGLSPFAPPQAPMQAPGGVLGPAPTGVTGLPVQTSPGTPATPGGLNAAQQAIVEEGRARGYSDHQIAAVLGSAKAESTFRPHAYNPNDVNGPSGGLFQWHDNYNTGERRFTKMTQAVPDWRTNPRGQAKYFFDEIETGGEKAAGSRLRSARNIEESTQAMNSFERFRGWQAGIYQGEGANRYANAQGQAGILRDAPTAQPAVPPSSLQLPQAPSVMGAQAQAPTIDQIQGTQGTPQQSLFAQSPAASAPTSAASGTQSNPQSPEAIAALAARIQQFNPSKSGSECVALAKDIAGMSGSVSTWRRGENVLGRELPAGTPIATFLDRQGRPSDRYDGGQGVGIHARDVMAQSGLQAGTTHAAILAGYEKDKNGNITGMKVWDQWAGSGGPHLRVIPVGDKRGGEKDAANYFSINDTEGKPMGSRNPLASQQAPTATPPAGAVPPAIPPGQPPGQQPSGLPPTVASTTAPTPTPSTTTPPPAGAVPPAIPPGQPPRQQPTGLPPTVSSTTTPAIPQTQSGQSPTVAASSPTSAAQGVTSTQAGPERFKVTGSAAQYGVQNVDPNLVAAAREASKYLPEGYSVQMESGLRPGDRRFHGQGMAADFAIIDPQGNRLGNYQEPEHFRVYEKFAQDAKAAMDRMAPDQSSKLRWGGYFGGQQGPGGTYGANDLMHFDMGGNRVGMAAGSWEKGLNKEYRGVFDTAQNPSVGMGRNYQSTYSGATPPTPTFAPLTPPTVAYTAPTTAAPTTPPSAGAVPQAIPPGQPPGQSSGLPPTVTSIATPNVGNAGTSSASALQGSQTAGAPAPKAPPIQAIVDQGERGPKNTGNVVIRDPSTGNVLGTYPFVTGNDQGRGRGSAPFGTYDIDPNMMRGGSLGDRWAITQQGQQVTGSATDPGIPGVVAPGTQRGELRIHRSQGVGTLGCIGIIGDDKVYADFQKNMMYVMNQTGGKTSIQLGTPQAAAAIAQMQPTSPTQITQTQVNSAREIPLDSSSASQAIPPGQPLGQQPPAAGSTPPPMGTAERQPTQAQAPTIPTQPASPPPAPVPAEPALLAPLQVTASSRAQSRDTAQAATPPALTIPPQPSETPPVSIAPSSKGTKIDTAPTASPTSIPTPTSTPATPTPSPTPVSAPTASPTSIPTPTSIPAASPTPTPAPTVSPTPTAPSAPVSTSAASPTPTPTPVSKDSSSPEPSAAGANEAADTPEKSRDTLASKASYKESGDQDSSLGKDSKGDDTATEELDKKDKPKPAGETESPTTGDKEESPAEKSSTSGEEEAPEARPAPTTEDKASSSEEISESAKDTKSSEKADEKDSEKESDKDSKDDDTDTDKETKDKPKPAGDTDSPTKGGEEEDSAAEQSSTEEAPKGAPVAEAPPTTAEPAALVQSAALVDSDSTPPPPPTPTSPPPTPASVTPQAPTRGMPELPPPTPPPVPRAPIMTLPPPPAGSTPSPMGPPVAGPGSPPLTVPPQAAQPPGSPVASPTAPATPPVAGPGSPPISIPPQVMRNLPPPIRESLEDIQRRFQQARSSARPSASGGNAGPGDLGGPSQGLAKGGGGGSGGGGGGGSGGGGGGGGGSGGSKGGGGGGSGGGPLGAMGGLLNNFLGGNIGSLVSSALSGNVGGVLNSVLGGNLGGVANNLMSGNLGGIANNLMSGGLGTPTTPVPGSTTGTLSNFGTPQTSPADTANTSAAAGTATPTTPSTPTTLSTSAPTAPSDAAPQGAPELPPTPIDPQATPQASPADTANTSAATGTATPAPQTGPQEGSDSIASGNTTTAPPLDSMQQTPATGVTPPAPATVENALGLSVYQPEAQGDNPVMTDYGLNDLGTVFSMPGDQPQMASWDDSSTGQIADAGDDDWEGNPAAQASSVGDVAVADAPQINEPYQGDFSQQEDPANPEGTQMGQTATNWDIAQEDDLMAETSTGFRPFRVGEV